MGDKRELSSHTEEDLTKYVFVLRDISLEKRLQREKVTQQYLQVMFASISHDFRTPINVIMNCIRCLEP